MLHERHALAYDRVYHHQQERIQNFPKGGGQGICQLTLPFMYTRSV